MIRNKTLIQGFALAALMPLFAACSSEDDATVPNGEAQPVQINITRATTDDNSSWADGDAVKLFITPTSGAATTETLNYNGSGWDKSTIIMTLPATVTAAYPSSATSTTGFNLPEDQSDESKLRQADYLTSNSQSVNDTNTPLDLTLVHRACKVTITISGYDGYADTPTVANERFSSYLTISYSDGGWTGTGSITNNITPFKKESSADGKHTYQAIVAPASSYEPFMTLTVNGKSRTVNCDQTLVSGNAYTFTLTVSNNELTLTPTDTFFGGSGWGTENNEVQIN